MYGQQASIDPSLAALLQTAQMVTPDQTPTVAAQVAQAAQQKLQPQGIAQGMPEARQDFQDAMPSMMRNMQQQQMQQMVQQAMQPKPAGIEGLPSNIRMAEGGVVGFAGDGEFGSSVPEAIAVDELRVAEARRRQEEEERRRKLAALELFGAPQAVQYRQPQTEVARPSVLPTPPMSPEAQRMTDRQVSRGGAPKPPAPTAQRQPAQVAQATPQGGIAALPATPTIDKLGISAAGEAITKAAADREARMRGILSDREKMAADMADLSAEGIAALQEANRARQELLGKQRGDDKFNRQMALLRGFQGDRAAYDRAVAGQQARDEAANQAQLMHQQAVLKLREAQQAKQLGQFDRAMAFEQQAAELEGKARTSSLEAQRIAASLATSEYSGLVNVRGQDMEARNAELNREANRKLEEYRRQTQLMKPKEQGMVERLEKLRLDEITGGKPATATPAQRVQALRSAIQDSRGTGVEERTDLGNLRLRATMIQNELKEMMVDSPRKQQLQRELDGIYRQLGGSPTGAPQGTVDKNNPLLK
jgi:hypothetical protein